MYQKKSATTCPKSDANPKVSKSKSLPKKRPDAKSGRGESQDDCEPKNWLGMWWQHASTVIAFCPASKELDRQGYKLVKHTARFGTILSWRKGDDWKFIIPAEPNRIMTRKESLEYIRDHWTLRHKEDELYFRTKILLPLSTM